MGRLGRCGRWAIGSWRAGTPSDLRFFQLDERPGVVIAPVGASDGRRPIDYIDTSTLETTSLVPDADALASVGFDAELDDALYFVRYAGEDAGLWGTRLPPP